MHPPSALQQEIIDGFADGNVRIQAVAGAGKTTTIMHLAKAYPDRHFLLLTYNARLKFETKDRVKMLELNNIEVYSYHSFCVKHIDESCYTDRGIILAMRDGRAVPERIPQYDAIVFDEVQDMTPLYHSLAKLFLTAQRKPPHVCVLGDPLQSIFGFNGADERYLLNVERAFPSPLPWKHYEMRDSYRCPAPVANFVNSCYGYEVMRGVRESNTRVQYIIDQFSMNYTLNVLKRLIDTYGASNIFVLGASVKSDTTPIRILANNLKTSWPTIQMYVSDNNESLDIDDNILKNKLVFTTIHQVKGLERKAVMIIGFDAEYYRLYNRSADPSKCCNELYVGMTRAQRRLVLTQLVKNEPLSFIDRTYIEANCLMSDEWSHGEEKNAYSQTTFKRSVVQFLQFMTAEQEDTALSFLNIEVIREPDENPIEIPVQKQQKHRVEAYEFKTYEAVSDITGDAIPLHYEYLKTGHMHCTKTPPIMTLGVITSEYIEDLLRLATIKKAKESRYIYRPQQILKYAWLKPGILNKCVEHFEELFANDPTPKFEYPEKKQYGAYEISGRIDAYVKETGRILEFKCTKMLSDAHVLQTAIYAWLMDSERAELFNVLTRERRIITATMENLNRMIDYIISVKGETGKRSDEEFLASL